MTPTAWTPDYVQAFAASVSASPFGMAGPIDVLAGSFLYEFEDGPRRAFIAARPVKFDAGKRLDIVGMVSMAERLTPGAFGPELMEIAKAHDAQALTMCTKWPHIVRACARMGWQKTGVIMTKKIIYER